MITQIWEKRNCNSIAQYY